ncbi:hypothetical protein [Streptomyces alboflavus]|uniref:hypothetical protein n=1 Tax=Streptomyces alboflavus TaxID=67267 RepID=UPI0006917E9C|nr:hypothetical protein [Streptomyces alboflavus]
MTSRRRTAIACYTGAALLATAAAYTGHHGHVVPTVGLVYGVLTLLWCGRCDAAADRRVRALMQRAERAARPASPPPPAPCCSFWQHSDGEVHAPDCPRPTAARTPQDGAPLDAHERAVIADIEAHYDHGTAA